MAPSPTPPRPVEIIGNHWIHRDPNCDSDAKFYRRDEVDGYVKGLRSACQFAADELTKACRELDRVKAEAERLRAANRWIRVSDAFPPIIRKDGFSEEVLCWNGKEMFPWGCYQRSNMETPCWCYPNGEVAYWRKVEPPEEEE